MSTQYDEVVQILRDAYRWTPKNTPAIEQTELQLQTDAPDQVAATLNGFIHSVVAGGLPWDVKPEDGYEWACRQWFYEGQKYHELNTAIALGQQHEMPVDTIGPAESPTQWWAYQEKLRNRLGEKLCAQEEFDRRKSFATNVPVEWLRGTDAMIWQLAVREGYMPVGMTGFDPSYLQTNPRLKDVRGLSAIQWMENLRAADLGRPWPWLAGKANPAVKP